MRIFKPQHLSAIHRCFEREDKAYLGVSILGFMAIGSSPQLLSEQELWQFIPANTPAGLAFETGVTRLGGEYLILGNACAPGGTPVRDLKLRQG